MQPSETPVVILAGGKGMRLREYTEFMPKGLVPIGSIPVLLHVMKIYAHQGFRRFILCLGYKGDMIKKYLTGQNWLTDGMQLEAGGPMHEIKNFTKELGDFDVTFVDTGLDTETGGRIKKVEKYIKGDNFFANYCDGLCDVDLKELLSFHLNKGKVATVTGVSPMSQFGILEVEDGLAVSFKEKPKLPGLINGGYFVFNKRIFDYLDEDSVLEQEPLRRLASEKQLTAFTHKGFWQCMDTYKDFERLNKLWETGNLPHFDLNYAKPPWKIWD